MYLETWKYMFLRRSLASLARAYISYFFSVGTFGGLAPPPPPNTKKLATSSRERAKPPADDVYCDAVYLCMITSELFRWYTKLWQLFLLESWAIILTDVVRIREEILPWFQTPWCWIIRRRNGNKCKLTPSLEVLLRTFQFISGNSEDITHFWWQNRACRKISVQ